MTTTVKYPSPHSDEDAEAIIAEAQRFVATKVPAEDSPLPNVTWEAFDADGQLLAEYPELHFLLATELHQLLASRGWESEVDEDDRFILSRPAETDEAAA
jgi:hypothetical protein